MKMALILFATLFFSIAGLVKAAQAENSKILVAYFSWSGNTRGIAQQIQQQTGGDIFEIVPSRAYSTNYNTVLDEALRGQRDQARPPLKNRVENMGQYDVIFIGYPNWWASIPMPVATFLESYDFTGKTVVPFCSHGGGLLGQSVAAIAKLSPNSKILEALSVHYTGGRSLNSDITAWLNKIGLGK
ncbi:MAG: flavodoxin [Deltaproteobacteria bacterium]|nr:flavodoxin [Deltaproteobacteria bacterium]